MAQTIKTNFLCDQIEIKRSLFEMVTSVEMGLANAQADQSFCGISADTYSYYQQGQYEECYYTQCPPNSNGEMQ
jgi:hypothetical protein